MGFRRNHCRYEQCLTGCVPTLGVPMRRTLAAALIALSPAIAAGQQRDTLDRQNLPREVRREVVNRWNGTAATRSSGRLELDEGREVQGDVAVQNGPLLIGGHITGNVLAINAD